MEIGKEINGYQNDHTLEAKTCMKNSQSESESIP